MEKILPKNFRNGKVFREWGNAISISSSYGYSDWKSKRYWRLLDNTHISVKLTLDTGHMLFAQGIKKIIANYSERILHVHCKDIRKMFLINPLKMI